MILIVGLGLAAVLRIVIPLGSPGSKSFRHLFFIECSKRQRQDLIYSYIFHFFAIGRTSTEWLEAAGTSAGCLAAAAFLLYLWIVVLELFIRWEKGQNGNMSLGK